MQNANIAIITVNYRSGALVCEAIESIAQERLQFPNIRLIVVDNDSGDDSVELINGYLDREKIDWVTLLEAGKNGGYAFGNNTAIRHLEGLATPPDFLWFLNPDTKLREGATEALIEFLNSNPRTLVGSRLEDEDGTLQISTFNFPSLATEFLGAMRLGILDRTFSQSLITVDPHDQIIECDWLAGASVMMSWSDLQEVGLMDEKFFLYYEEVDFFIKAKKLGLTCAYEPKSRVYHAVGASTGISNLRKRAPRRPRYWFDSRRYFYLKNYGILFLIALDLIVILAYSSWSLRSFLFNRNVLDLEPPKFLHDYIANSFLFRGFGT